MARVETVLDLVLSRNLYAVVNVHHDSWQWADFSNPTATQSAQFTALWEQIAKRFKDKSHLLILESLNEPPGSTAEHAEAYNVVNAEFVRIVRGSGGKNTNRLLTLPGLNTNIQQTVDYFKEPENAQPYILHVHDYDPWDFVSTSWGRTFWGTADDKAAIEATFAAIQTKFAAPALIGEWGLTGRGIDPGYSWIYFDFIVRTARKYQLATQLWDNGFDHYDRVAYAWRDPVKPQLIVNAAKGILNALPSYGQLANLYVPANDTGLPLEIKLDFNTRTLKKVTTNTDRVLKKGTDYTVSTTGVTITPAYLKTLNLVAIGLRETFTLHFNAGVALPFDLVVYKTPTTTTPSITVTDTSAGIVIPVSGNGASLATVKAIAEDGTLLKDDWTQWLGELQAGRINYGDYEEVTGGVKLSSGVLEVARGRGKVSFTLEYWPRGVGNDVTVVVEVV